MADHINIGQRGEVLAAEYLQEKAYDIIATNWRSSRWEVDIIARQNDTFIFVEVKTRKSLAYGFPEEAVSAAKQAYLQEAAKAYLGQWPHEGDLRFDVIAILINKKKTEIEHIEDAFF